LNPKPIFLIGVREASHVFASKKLLTMFRMACGNTPQKPLGIWQGQKEKYKTESYSRQCKDTVYQKYLTLIPKMPSYLWAFQFLILFTL